MIWLLSFPFRGSNGQLVYVNPERINYIRTRNEKTVLYFDKDQSVDLEGSIAEVRALLDPSTRNLGDLIGGPF